ncbi:hypothetical protein [Streptomyces sp. NPDC086766]
MRWNFADWPTVPEVVLVKPIEIARASWLAAQVEQRVIDNPVMAPC